MSKPDFTQLMRLGWGFRESKIFLTAIDLDLFSLLSREPQLPEELALRLKLDCRALTIVMDALVAMGLLIKQHNCYRNQELVEIYLVKGKPTYRGEIFRHLHKCWENWNDLEGVLRLGHALPKDDILSEEADRDYNRVYIWGMDNVGQDRAALIVKNLDLSKVRKMLDVGGGAATYSIAFAKKTPQLESKVLDLPLTLEVARENIALNNLTERIDTVEGSYWEVDFGSGYDLVWISQVIHCLDEAQCIDLVNKAVAALAPGGRLIVHDFLLEDDCTSPYFAALFSAHMLVVTDGGRTYSVSEVQNWFNQAGLDDVHQLELDNQSGLIIGTKP